MGGQRRSLMESAVNSTGLSVGDACDMLRTELLVDFLLGHVGGAADRQEHAVGGPQDRDDAFR